MPRIEWELVTDDFTGAGFWKATLPGGITASAYADGRYQIKSDRRSSEGKIQRQDAEVFMRLKPWEPVEDREVVCTAQRHCEQVARGWLEEARRALVASPTAAQEGCRPLRLSQRWQQPLAEWQKRELPCEDDGKQRLRLALGVAEEVGEVARCVLKGDQNIRGGAEAWRVQLGQEIGDAAAFLIQLATLNGLDFEECVESAVAKVLARRFATAAEADDGGE